MKPCDGRSLAWDWKGTRARARQIIATDKGFEVLEFHSCKAGIVDSHVDGALAHIAVFLGRYGNDIWVWKWLSG
jgi:hypothetical protein